MLLLASLAFAGPTDTATLDVPIPILSDLDLLPEPGSTWPCALTVKVEGIGSVSGVDVDSGCPSGLVDTAKQLGGAWKWAPSNGAHEEKLTVRFTVLGTEEAAPKPSSTAADQHYLLRPYDVNALPPPTLAAPEGQTATPGLDLLLTKPKLPKAAEAMGIVAGTCVVRVAFTDGKVTNARPTRCLDVFAGPAVDAALKTKLAKGSAPPPKEIDLPVRFEAPK